MEAQHFSYHRGYTGHEMLMEFDIINMNGRLYDPVIGRMLSPDNYAGLDGTSQGYNRYTYVNNNPLKYIDPSGEFLIPGLSNAQFLNFIQNIGSLLPNVNVVASAAVHTASNSVIPSVILNELISLGLAYGSGIDAAAHYLLPDIAVTPNNTELANHIYARPGRFGGWMSFGTGAGLSVHDIQDSQWNKEFIYLMHKFVEYTVLDLLLNVATGGGGSVSRVRNLIVTNKLPKIATAKSSTLAARLSSNGAKLNQHLAQLEKYGSGGYKTLQNGRIRYFMVKQP